MFMYATLYNVVTPSSYTIGKLDGDVGFYLFIVSCLEIEEIKPTLFFIEY